MNNLTKNKKGYIGGVNSFIFGIFGLVMLLFVVMALIPIQGGNVDVAEMLTVLNNTQNSTMGNFAISADNTPVVNILHSALSFVFYATFEIVKLAVQYSVDNPEVINAKTMLLLMTISLGIPILYYVCALLLLLFLSVKELAQSSADKRKLRRLENESKGI